MKDLTGFTLFFQSLRDPSSCLFILITFHFSFAGWCSRHGACSYLRPTACSIPSARNGCLPTVALPCSLILRHLLRHHPLRLSTSVYSKYSSPTHTPLWAVSSLTPFAFPAKSPNWNCYLYVCVACLMPILAMLRCRYYKANSNGLTQIRTFYSLPSGNPEVGCSGLAGSAVPEATSFIPSSGRPT